MSSRGVGEMRFDWMTHVAHRTRRTCQVIDHVDVNVHALDDVATKKSEPRVVLKMPDV